MKILKKMKIKKSLLKKKPRIHKKREEIVIKIKKNKNKVKSMMIVENSVISNKRKNNYKVGHLNRTKKEMVMILKKKIQEF